MRPFWSWKTLQAQENEILSSCNWSKLALKWSIFQRLKARRKVENAGLHCEIFNSAAWQWYCTCGAHWRSCCARGSGLHCRVLQGEKRWSAAGVTPGRGKSPCERGTLQHKLSFLRNNKPVRVRIKLIRDINAKSLHGLGLEIASQTYFSPKHKNLWK